MECQQAERHTVVQNLANNFTEKCGIDLPCNRNHLSAQFVSEKCKSLEVAREPDLVAHRLTSNTLGSLLGSLLVEPRVS